MAISDIRIGGCAINLRSEFANRSSHLKNNILINPVVMTRQELENRLIDFAVEIIALSDKIPNTRAGNTLANQIVRSGTSPALNYGEAQSAESTPDLIHKFQIILKELRETNIALKIIKKSELFGNQTKLEILIKENNELISIFVSSINSLKRKLSKK